MKKDNTKAIATIICVVVAIILLFLYFKLLLPASLALGSYVILSLGDFFGTNKRRR